MNEPEDSKYINQNLVNLNTYSECKKYSYKKIFYKKFYL